MLEANEVQSLRRHDEHLLNGAGVNTAWPSLEKYSLSQGLYLTSTSGICRNFYLRTSSPTTYTSKGRLDNTTAVFYSFLKVACIFNLPSRTCIAPETCISTSVLPQPSTQTRQELERDFVSTKHTIQDHRL